MRHKGKALRDRMIGAERVGLVSDCGYRYDHRFRHSRASAIPLVLDGAGGEHRKQSQGGNQDGAWAGPRASRIYIAQEISFARGMRTRATKARRPVATAERDQAWIMEQVRLYQPKRLRTLCFG